MQLPKGFEPVEGRPGWNKSAIDDWETLEKCALTLHEQFPVSVQVVCGLLGRDMGHSIYVIENVSPLELVREFETGSHNSSDDPDDVYDELSRVFKVAPFRPYFVDSAGYKARFLKRLTIEQAREIDQILTVGMEGYMCEWTGDEDCIPATLVKENLLRLWWD